MKLNMKSHRLQGVQKYASKIYTENFQLGPHKYENSGNCRIIQIEYDLDVNVVPDGLYTDLIIRIPITIGDIKYGSGSRPMFDIVIDSTESHEAPSTRSRRMASRSTYEAPENVDY